MATPDVKILTEVAWALSFLTAREDEPVDQVARMGLIPHLVNMMAPAHPALAFPAVRVAGTARSGARWRYVAHHCSACASWCCVTCAFVAPGNMCGCHAQFAEAFLACPAFLTNLANLLISKTLRCVAPR